MEMLSAKNVDYIYQSKYQKVQALKDVSCSFEAGTFYAIIGHSGSGKTTLLSVLAGLGTPVRGSVYVGETPLDEIGQERHRRENVSLIYQGFHLFPTLTVLENVMYPMQIVKRSQKEAAARARELLASVGLKKEQEKKFPAMLSGGEQQRVAIARALSSSAKVILADEPTGNLDTENGKVVIGLLKQLVAEKNYCVIVVTHDLDIAAQADVVYRMTDGKLDREERAV
ncbi:ABC transporter ATP-binding protein [Neglecta sp. X4]|uniref:ABC transporter ATP-binding protein n=1 Tax=unclassified Neglectibacter TaxID=2632164 RepID=UPI001371C725|nr:MULTISPECIES: ABC transporter ATP-binding protein [unclassified Neglectibacter]NBI17697.1 ABC transporter ATP-binding protein [Neglectibacter sp. 59]NBJ73207.1 ABC transporter ATP-binding protein [Neglectibacter sp. X4]NCE81090.1 ABC transporter ATP-binding protein [Neglectibacter sp. X58]